MKTFVEQEKVVLDIWTMVGSERTNANASGSKKGCFVNRKSMKQWHCRLSFLKMEETSFFETVIPIYETTRCHIPENHSHNQVRTQNFPWKEG
jgi:hypothetical protein